MLSCPGYEPIGRTGGEGGGPASDPRETK